jgi:hypothetical protein
MYNPMFLSASVRFENKLQRLQIVFSARLEFPARIQAVNEM